MTEPNQHLLNCAITARAALHALAEQLHDTYQGDPLLSRVDGTGDAIQRWLERHMPLDSEPNVAPGVAPHVAHVAPHVAPPQQPLVAPPVTPVAPERPRTATAAVQLAYAQLGEGATSTEASRYILREWGIDVTPSSIRTIKKRNNASARPRQSEVNVAPPAQQPATPSQQGTGMYL